MNYEKAYKETVEQVYLLQAQLLGYEQREERLDLLFRFGDFIAEYRADYDAMPKKSLKATRFLENLIELYKRYGEFYSGEVIHRRELYLKDKELMEARKKLLELKEENEKLRKTIEFQNEE